MALFRAEILKLKNSGMLWLATVGCLLCNVILAGTGYYLSHTEVALIEIEPINDWESWISWHYKGVSPMLLPMFLVILCALSISLEQRANTWKLLYSLPIPASSIYLMKSLAITLLFASSHLLFAILMVLSPPLLGFAFGARPPIQLVFSLYTATVISSLGILGLVYFVSYFSNRFILPLAIGILGFVFAQLLIDNQIEVWWLPFANPASSINGIIDDALSDYLAMINSVLVFLLFSIGGMVNARRKVIRT